MSNYPNQNYGFGWNPQGGAYTPYQNTGYNGPTRDNRNYNKPYAPAQTPAKKLKGCKKFLGKNGNEYIGGWFIDRYAGLVKVLVFATKHSGTVHKGEKNGREWVSMAAKVTYVNSGQVSTHSALLDVAKGTVSVKDLNIGLSPAKNWCGFYFKSKR